VAARGDDVVAGPGVDREQDAGVVGEREQVPRGVIVGLVLVDGDRLIGAQAVGAVDDDAAGAGLVDRRGDEGVDVGELDDLDEVGRDLRLLDDVEALGDGDGGLDAGRVGDDDGVEEDPRLGLVEVGEGDREVVAADVAAAELLLGTDAGAGARVLVAGEALEGVAGLVVDPLALVVADLGDLAGALLVALGAADAADAFLAAHGAHHLVREPAHAVAGLGDVALADDRAVGTHAAGGRGDAGRRGGLAGGGHRGDGRGATAGGVGGRADRGAGVHAGHADAAAGVGVGAGGGRRGGGGRRRGGGVGGRAGRAGAGRVGCVDRDAGAVVPAGGQGQRAGQCAKQGERKMGGVHRGRLARGAGAGQAMVTLVVWALGYDVHARCGSRTRGEAFARRPHKRWRCKYFAPAGVGSQRRRWAG
jgi:hypothetical protein